MKRDPRDWRRRLANLRRYEKTKRRLERLNTTTSDREEAHKPRLAPFVVPPTHTGRAE